MCQVPEKLGSSSFGRGGAEIPGVENSFGTMEPYSKLSE